MKYEEIIKELDSKIFLEKLYGFAYNRCNTSYEAEELCSNIIFSVISSVHKNSDINNLYAFVWTIARRVYADYCKKRKYDIKNQILEDGINDVRGYFTSSVDEWIEAEEDKYYINKIMKEIGFLSKIHREVIILYYLDELKVAQIAQKLGISETAVKQRLFSARNIIKEEVKVMNKNYTLRPNDITFIGMGNPIGNNPTVKAERILSKNLILSCKDYARSAKEISEELNVPMPYIEEEIDIQIKGENGQYGLLRRIDSNKYISNVIIMDIEKYNKAAGIYREIMHDFHSCLTNYMEHNEKRIMEFPFLNKVEDMGYIVWALMPKIIWFFNERIISKLASKYFVQQGMIEREFSVIGIVHKPYEAIDMNFYGCDGIMGRDIGGYKEVFIANTYGRRLKKHFECEHNMSTDPQMLLTIKAIEGVNINTLSEVERECAARAIENGYIKRQGEMLTTNMLVLNRKDANNFYALSEEFGNQIEDLIEKVADKLYVLIKKLVPRHLIDEYATFVLLMSTPLADYSIEKCIEEGILTVPKKMSSGEGMWMIVSK